ncbi:MAG TPA: hypothetical protein VFY28_03430, partial [Candidatus Paceibacterota bacterium]|nr:hypothetical protein [Candidatus Paceibacterota bacterium]
VVQQGLLASYVARDELIAASLAEEGLEFIRSRRDGNYLYNLSGPVTPRSWLYGMNGTPSGAPNCYSGNGCVVDPPQNTIATFATSTAPLRLSTLNRYTQVQSGGTATRFMRKVQFTNVSATEVKITVTVMWSTNRIPFTVRVTDTLHDWL